MIENLNESKIWTTPGHHHMSICTYIMCIDMHISYHNIHIYISADPSLRQGRGGAWDHRRCGTFPTRTARNSYHKATARAQGHLPAAAMASYRRSRLPFARPQTLQNPPNAPKVRIAPQGQGTPTSPTRATPARKSHHKATAMAQGHPPAAAMASFRRSRLPFARPQTLQNPPKPSKRSKPSKSSPSSAGTK